jgi:transposase
MVTARLSVRKIREILRLSWGLGLKPGQVATSCNIARSTVQEYLLKAQAAGLSWPLALELDDGALEALLFSRVGRPRTERPLPDFDDVARSLRSHKGMSLALEWQRYISANPRGYQYSYFCQLYLEWSCHVDLVMRQEHLAGEKAFSDFAGSKLRITNRHNGVVEEAHLFVCCLGASSYTFAKAFRAENSEAWCVGHADAFAYFRGCPEIVVPDNPKAVVTKACPYEPDIHLDFQLMADHFNIAVIPARVRKPKDKAKVEAAVKMATRWIIAVLKDQTFFSLPELNQAIAGLLEKLNARPFKKMPGSRRSQYELIDKPALRPLPLTPYEYTQVGKAKVFLDYHIDLDGYRYSVPYQYVNKKIEYRLNHRTLEIFYKGNRIASHTRLIEKHPPATRREHMPAHHSFMLDWTPERFTSWARKIGPCTEQLIQVVLASREFPQQAFRSCLGILSLSKEFANDRLERASSIALSVRATSYKSVKLILQNQQDKRRIIDAPVQLKIIHSHIRGAEAFGSATNDKENNNAHSSNDREPAQSEAIRHGESHGNTNASA